MALVKSILDKNGEPMVFKHHCTLEQEGKPIGYDELETFIARSIADAYASRGTDYVWNAKRQDHNSPHFTLKMKDYEVNVVVNIDHVRIDNVKEMTDLLIKRRQIPRVYIAETYCIETEGKNNVCGGNYCVKFQPISLLVSEVNHELKQMLSTKELVDKVTEAWRRLDADIIEPYLDKDLNYGSDWVFDILPSRAEYLHYIRGKFASIKQGRGVDVSPLLYSRLGLTGVILRQGNTESFLEVKTCDGRITEMRMRPESCLYEGIEPEPVVINTDEKTDNAEEKDESLYQVHGDHMDALMTKDEMFARLPKWTEEAKLCTSVTTRVAMEDFDGETKAAGLIYGDEERVMAMFIAHNPQHKANELVTFYPIFFDGSTHTIEITKVEEWDNHLEATVWGTIDGFEVAFFPTDYIDHKSSYKTGRWGYFNLSALAMRVGPGQTGFSFEGQKAIDFLAKTNEAPIYDENGEVKPIHFSMTNLVAYLATDKRCPDEAEFQSPVKTVSEVSFLGHDFYRADITIHRFSENDTEINVPLYFRKDLMPDTVKVGDSIQGWLWMMGEIVSSSQMKDISSGKPPLM